MTKIKNSKITLTVLLIASILMSLIMPLINARADAEDIKLSLDMTPEMDIVLTKGITDLSLEDFEDKIKPALVSRGIDVSKLNVIAIDAVEQDVFEGKFTMNLMWGASPRADIDTYLTFLNGNTKVNELFFGNRAGIYGSSIDIDDLYGGKGEWTTVDFDGVPAHVNKLDFKADLHSGSATNVTFSLFRTVNGIRENMIVDTKRVSGKKPNFTSFGNIRRNGDSWDFHYTNGQVFKGKETILKSKKFSEVIRQPEWRDGTQRYLVNVENNNLDDFSNPATSNEILTRLIGEEIHYIGAGREGNKKQVTDLVKKNNGNGAHYSNLNYENLINDIADYIKAQQPKASGSNYVLLGQPFNLTVNPESLLKDTATPEYPNGRWRVDHEYDFYDNDMGQTDWTNQWQRDLDLKLDKTGRYEVRFGDKYTSPRYLYVHRRPIADFGFILSSTGTSYNVSLQDNSYDPDMEHKDPNRGIVDREWKWRESTSDEWIDGKLPSALTAGKDYIVQLRVKDQQGEWSIPEARYITTSNVKMPPVASFRFDQSTKSKYEELGVNDYSYDPAGMELITFEWTVTKDGRQIYKGATPMTNFKNQPDGDYLVSLRVQNAHSLWSEAYSRIVTITDDTSSPTAIVNPANVEHTQDDIDINIKFMDIGGSGVKRQRHVITSDYIPPLSNDSSWGAWGSEESIDIALKDEGRYYIHIEAEDNAGNTFTRTVGEYLIDRTKPTITFTEENIDVNDKTTIKIDAFDELSGIKEIRYETMQGTIRVIEDNELTVKHNGEYKFIAEDKAGNISEIIYDVKTLDKTITFTVPEIENFGSYEIKHGINEIETTVGEMTIQDWRGNPNPWDLQVSATQMNGPNVLSKGNLSFNINEITRTEGEGPMPTNEINESTIIDNGAVTILSSTPSRGEYKVDFGNLVFKANGSEIMAGTYNTKITWTMVHNVNDSPE